MDTSRKPWVRGYRLAFALLAVAAIVVQVVRSSGGGFPLVNFFSFFTIESNIFGIAVLLWGVLWPGKRPSLGRDLVRGAAVLYLAITGIVYGVLLAGYQEELQTTIPWVDTVLHKVMPLTMVFDWLVVPPSRNLRFRNALIWLAYPVAYVAYSLIRGPRVDWYPYPFLDPGQTGGYAMVGAYIVGIAVAAVLFTLLVVLIGRHVRLVVGRGDW